MVKVHLSPSGIVPLLDEDDISIINFPSLCLTFIRSVFIGLHPPQFNAIRIHMSTITIIPNRYLSMFYLTILRIGSGLASPIISFTLCPMRLPPIKQDHKRYHHTSHPLWVKSCLKYNTTAKNGIKHSVSDTVNAHCPHLI